MEQFKKAILVLIFLGSTLSLNKIPPKTRHIKNLTRPITWGSEMIYMEIKGVKIRALCTIKDGEGFYYRWYNNSPWVQLLHF